MEPKKEASVVRWNIASRGLRRGWVGLRKLKKVEYDLGVMLL